MFYSHLQNQSKFTAIFLNLLVFLVSSEELEILTIRFLKVLCQKPDVCKCGCAVWNNLWSCWLQATATCMSSVQLILCGLLSCTSVKRGENPSQNWSCVLTVGQQWFCHPEISWGVAVSFPSCIPAARLTVISPWKWLWVGMWCCLVGCQWHQSHATSPCEQRDWVIG